jgi:NAD(P)-dependent dehydrogenase (short-subunit alcohol dehydrogenase family)
MSSKPPKGNWAPTSIPDQSGKTALVTGANAGIGFQTARELARHGARVIMAGRSQEKLDQAVAAIETEISGANLQTLILDLGDLAQVGEAAKQVAATETVDLLINNAGVMNIPTRTVTKDGFETTFGTNHLGPFAFTLQVLPALRRAEHARIVNVSAQAAAWKSGISEDLLSEQGYKPMSAYAKSKRANVVFTQELSRRLAGTGIEVLVIHPGSALTDLQRHSSGPMWHLINRVIAPLLMSSPEGAAWPTLYAATSPDVHSGEYIGPYRWKGDTGTPRPAKMPPDADSPTAGKWLWDQSVRLTGIDLTN